jgi:hypothetical protein
MEANSASELPNGVVQEGATPAAPPPAQPASPVEAATHEPGTEVMEEGGSIKNWNWLEIAAGIALLTVVLFATYYYRVRTYKTDKDIKDHDNKLSTLETELQKLKQPQDIA